MRVTIPGDIDLDVRPGTPAAAIARAAALTELWCGSVRLDAEHPAGVAPLLHGALLTGSPGRERCAARDAEGAVIRVVAGPDAGSSAVVPAAGLIVGRAPHCDLRIDDAAVSGEHVLITAGPPVRVRDAGSLNGTGALWWWWRRTRRLVPGEALVVGRSRIVLDGEVETASRERSRPAWGALAAGAAGGVALGAITGRWYLALIGIVAPAALLVASVLSRFRARRTAPSPWQPPAGPVAVVGEERWARGYVRAVAVARGRRPSGDDWQEPWMRWLEPAQPDDALVHVPPGAVAPSWCASTVHVSAQGRREGASGAPARRPPLAMSAVTAEARARADASIRGDTGLPMATRWGDLVGVESVPAQPEQGCPRTLVATVGQGLNGPVTIDLDADGPHLLVAGTTGSGKSVTLETLVAALALEHSPIDLAIALVDFKGGAGLRECVQLPHVCGVLTDLDGALAGRVIAALTHELTARKRAVAERGWSSLAQWECAGGAPPRLLVVIDEYQEIVSRHPGFMPDLARLAAQGRSLGLHLVLATQRPAGAVTPEVRANVSTTIALRVASAAESRDLLGSPAAAEIPVTAPGRALVMRGSTVEPAQIAAPLAEPSPAVHVWGAQPAPGMGLAEAARRRWASAASTLPLWVEPLPTRWTPGHHDQIAFALADWPHERRQEPVLWDPTDGPAVIVGGPRSGRTSALRSIAAQAATVGLEAVWLPQDSREAARTLALAALRAGILLVIDDAERALACLSDVDDGAAADALLARLARRAPTALACAPHAPVRLGAAAAVTALLNGAEGSSSAWGAPRDRSLSHVGPGRGWVSSAGAWVESQLGYEETSHGRRLVSTLPTTVAGHWAVGGDQAAPLAMPTGRIAVVGAPGPERDRVAAGLTGAVVTCHDAPHLAPSADVTVVVDPTPRSLRVLAPRDWQGLTEPTPIDGRCAVIVNGVARAVQLGSG